MIYFFKSYCGIVLLSCCAEPVLSLLERLLVSSQNGPEVLLDFGVVQTLGDLAPAIRTWAFQVCKKAQLSKHVSILTF